MPATYNFVVEYLKINDAENRPLSKKSLYEINPDYVKLVSRLFLNIWVVLMDELKFPKKLLELGDREGARNELALFFRTNPNNIDAWFLLANNKVTRYDSPVIEAFAII